MEFVWGGTGIQMSWYGSNSYDMHRTYIYVFKIPLPSGLSREQGQKEGDSRAMRTIYMVCIMKLLEAVEMMSSRAKNDIYI